MEHQDWTTVVLKRRSTKPTDGGQGRQYVQGQGQGQGQGQHGLDRNERIRLAKLSEIDYAEAPKKQVLSESLQELIRKRMELKLNQDMADHLCHFPRHTFKGIESRRILPSSAQQSAIQKHLGVQLKIQTK
jgi:hypothetical protein